MTERSPTKKLVLSVLSAALARVATMSARISTPGTDGYIYPGDVIVILCGVSLDPVSTFLAVGIGLYMAGLLGGCFIYVPTTFVIKGLVTLSASHVYGRLRARGMNLCAVVAGCGVVDIVLVAGEHCLCEIFLCGLGTVLVGAPSNTTQGINDLIVSSALYPVLQKPLFMVLKAQTTSCIYIASCTCTASYI